MNRNGGLEVERSDSEDEAHQRHRESYDPRFPAIRDVMNPVQRVQGSFPVLDLTGGGSIVEVRQKGTNGEIVRTYYQCQATPGSSSGGLCGFALIPCLQSAATTPVSASFSTVAGRPSRQACTTRQSTPTVNYPGPSNQVQHVRASHRFPVSVPYSSSQPEVQQRPNERPSCSNSQQIEVAKSEAGDEDAEGNSWKHAARQYQLDLYRAALRKNIIAFLDTGAGKTFISVLLIRDVAARAEEVAKRNGIERKPIFFLVPSKVLVQQQAQVLRKHTDLEVSEHTGDRRNEDVWDMSVWNNHITAAQVLVMTPQILLNMLRKQYISIISISLIVFDECHHAKGNSPYNAIMQSFYHPAKDNKAPVPKIFGMTASLGSKKSGSGDVHDSILELEDNLDSVIMTSTRDNVKEFSTSATECIVPYSSAAMDSLNLSITDYVMERAMIRLNLCNQFCKLRKMSLSQDGKTWRMDNKKIKGPLDQHNKHIGNVYFLMKVMGLLPASYAINEVSHGWDSNKDIKGSNSQKSSGAGSNFPPPRELDERYERHPELRRENLMDAKLAVSLSFQDMVIAIVSGLLQISEEQSRQKVYFLTSTNSPSVQQLKLALRQIRKELDFSSVGQLIIEASRHADWNQGPDQIVSTFYSHKMQQLFRLLGRLKEIISSKEKKEWRGMIFVQQTLMALVLEHVIKLHPELAFYTCQSLTGHNTAIQAASMEDHHQRKIIRLFRSGKLNLLLCTSVAEEGLDITHCSMVMRFDLPSTDASYIQSRGRARKPGAFYYMFLDQDDQGERIRIHELKRAEQCMKEFAYSRQQKEHCEAGLDEDIISGTEDAYLEMRQSESTALNIPVNSLPSEEDGRAIAAEMIHKYVSHLPQDEYCRLSPHLIFRSRDFNNQKQFQYQLTLPLNAAFSQPIFGEWCTSKQKAKSSACYIACVQLRELGQLNEQFYPISQKDRFASRRAKEIKLHPDLFSSDAPLDPEILRCRRVNKVDGVDQKSRRPPPGFSSELKTELHLLNVEIKNAPKSIIPRFGILTLKRLDELMSFELYTEQGQARVELMYGGEILVSDYEMNLLKRYHISILESLYFNTKLFSEIIHSAAHDFCPLLDSSLSFFPEDFKPFENQIPNINQSWYLITPLQPMKVEIPIPVETQGFDPMSSCKQMNDFDEDENDENDLNADDSSIDWRIVRTVSNRLERFPRPGDGVDASNLETGDVLFTPHNNSNPYKLVGIRDDLNLKSPFPAHPKAEFYHSSMTKEYRPTFIPNRALKSYDSFQEYYKDHWKFEQLNVYQPLLECIGYKKVPILKKAKNLLNPQTQHQNEMDFVEEREVEEGEEEEEVPVDNWNSAVHLVPQLCVVYPMKYPFWESLSYIVAVCWKIESMLKLLELRDLLFDNEERIDRGIPVLDIELLFESMTCRSCHEKGNYERLEFIGDAALKYISSLYCFFKFPIAHEGILTTERSDLISNRHLAEVAVSAGIQNYIRSVQIGEHPWRPAGCQLLDGYWIKLGGNPQSGADWFGGRNKKISLENEKHQSKTVALKFKQVADVVEALIGACYIHGGISFACALIDRLGIFDSSISFLASSNQSLCIHKESTPWLKEAVESMIPGLEGFQEYEKLRSRQFQHGRDIHSIEESIGYRFEASSFALEALTHCSWAHGDPPCYQRLEYLGDAVLDFMVSLHYFSNFKNMDPGKLTALRSASVNNDKLAANAVKLGFQKCLLHFSSILQSHITDYVGRLDTEQEIIDTDKGAPKVLGDIVESLIGAVYLDLYGDLGKTWDIWKPLLEPFYTPETIPTHPIVQLTTICQRAGRKCEFVRARKKQVEVKDNTEDVPTLEVEVEVEEQEEGLDEMNLSVESDSEEEEMEWKEELSGKRGLEQLEPVKTVQKVVVQVLIDGVVYGEGSGSHMKIAKKQAAVEALQSENWMKQ